MLKLVYSLNFFPSKIYRSTHQSIGLVFFSTWTFLPPTYNSSHIHPKVFQSLHFLLHIVKSSHLFCSLLSMPQSSCVSQTASAGHAVTLLWCVSKRIPHSVAHTHGELFFICCGDFQQAFPLFYSPLWLVEWEICMRPDWD